MLDPEIKRKSLHLVAAAVPLAVMYLPAAWALYCLAALAALSGGVDILKYRLVLLGRVYTYFFGSILREHEKKGALTGATYFFFSLLLAQAVFVHIAGLPAQLIAVVYTGFMVGDAAAALTGKRWGRVRLHHTKTLEGSLAFCAAALASTFWIMPGQIHCPLLSALLLSLSELMIVKLDDNFFVPLIVLTVLTGLTQKFGLC